MTLITELSRPISVDSAYQKGIGYCTAAIIHTFLSEADSILDGLRAINGTMVVQTGCGFLASLLPDGGRGGAEDEGRDSTQMMGWTR